ncbi:uncharacterized protein LOC110387560 isoform X2 [Numida meleagris]|uniref:uncharacterized protein LOC110387560 isoform X2 n=1 Tax=Numida meleagris TaxID=8996 RepID=UPI000B3E1241|nr:uncharacterized protein LOC110387560 isoform X2 [Numida meleagris]
MRDAVKSTRTLLVSFVPSDCIQALLIICIPGADTGGEGGLETTPLPAAASPRPAGVGWAAPSPWLRWRTRRGTYQVPGGGRGRGRFAAPYRGYGTSPGCGPQAGARGATVPCGEIKTRENATEPQHELPAKEGIPADGTVGLCRRNVLETELVLTACPPQAGACTPGLWSPTMWFFSFANSWETAMSFLNTFDIGMFG